MKNEFDDIVVAKRKKKRKTKKYIIQANEFDDVYISKERQRKIDVQKKIQREEDIKQQLEIEKNRPKTPLLLETNTIPFLEINKSFQFLETRNQIFNLFIKSNLGSL